MVSFTTSSNSIYLCHPLKFRAMLQNESEYPDPFTFDPERYLKDGQLLPYDVSNDIHFGYGRRICPGRFMAMASLWHTIASTLATFNITKAVDANGAVIEPSGESRGSLADFVDPFQCDFRPRSDKVAQLIRATG